VQELLSGKTSLNAHLLPDYPLGKNCHGGT